MEVKGTYTDYAGIPRIPIPIRNNEGEFITLVGRRIDNNTDPRYLPFFKGFDKRHILYNYWRAKNFISVFEGRLFIVEGFKGCWRMVESGLYNTVACMGTSITEEQAKVIYKNLSIKEIILVLDGDQAGRKGIPRALNTLGMASRVYPVYLPFKTDPSMYSPNDLLDILSKQKNSFLVNLTNKLKGEHKYEWTK
jgi:DNA primase